MVWRNGPGSRQDLPPKSSRSPSRERQETFIGRGVLSGFLDCYTLHDHVGSSVPVFLSHVCWLYCFIEFTCALFASLYKPPDLLCVC